MPRMTYWAILVETESACLPPTAVPMVHIGLRRSSSQAGRLT